MMNSHLMENITTNQINDWLSVQQDSLVEIIKLIAKPNALRIEQLFDIHSIELLSVQEVNYLRRIAKKISHNQQVGEK